MTAATPGTIVAFGPRLIHTMLNVRDLPRALAFYCGVLGMQERRRIEFAAERYTLVFIGFAAQPSEPEVELRHDWDRAGPWAAGETSYGHLGIAVRDVSACVDALRAAGVPVRREAAAMRPGGRVIALVEDPDGNEVELLAAP